MRALYAEIEAEANENFLNALPDELKKTYREMLFIDEEYKPIIKAADKLSAYIKCIEERRAGNAEFKNAEDATLSSLKALNMREVDYFIKTFIPAYTLTLDEL